jgi:hypothetical protein
VSELLAVVEPDPPVADALSDVPVRPPELLMPEEPVPDVPEVLEPEAVDPEPVVAEPVVDPLGAVVAAPDGDGVVAEGLGVVPLPAAPVPELPLVCAWGAAHHTAAISALIARTFERFFIGDLRTSRCCGIGNRMQERFPASPYGEVRLSGRSVHQHTK